MHFRTADDLHGVQVDHFERLFFAEELNILICARLGLQRTLVSRQEVDGELQRQVTIRPQRDIPRVAVSLLGGRPAEYTEHMRYRYGSMLGHWTIVPTLFAERVHVAGTIAFAPTAGGVSRIVEGDIDVQFVGFGGLIERYIVADIHRSFIRAAELSQAELPRLLAAMHKAG